MPNLLINETSPYLLQHAHNPVEWHAWGEDALAKARDEDKPILVSIGYSACHWCHVMERESFENEDIARLMNDAFVNIKVDREERPDLDSIYMGAVQAMTGRGGWPLNVFLTPDGKPFFGGTYFPPDDRHGIAGWPKVLQAVARAYQADRSKVEEMAQQLTERLRHAGAAQAGLEPLTTEILNQAFAQLRSQFDWQLGGLAGAPKFPQPMSWEFALRHHHRTGDPDALRMVELTLHRMALGGIYDHLGGGFARYSTDQFWLTPHFEKMLYDNALLASLYLHAHQATGNPLYKRIVEETLDYLLRDMTAPEGGFFSAQDADSEGVEGKFYVWTPQEIAEILGPGDAPLFNAYYGVTQAGNFEGSNILNVPREAGTVAAELGISREALEAAVQRGRAVLLDARYERIPPALDDKVLTEWNGLALRAMAEAAVALERPDYRQAAERNAAFLLATLRQDGRLLRSHRAGRSQLKGYLADYAALIDGLMALHTATFELRWMNEARSLADEMIRLFWDSGQSVFFDTGTDHDPLPVRPRDIFDNALPSGNALAADVLLRLAALTGETDYAKPAVASLRGVREYLSRAPAGFGHWLGALDFYLSTPKEVVIAAAEGAPGTADLLRALHGRYLPNKVVMGLDTDASQDGAWPLLQGRSLIDGKATAYVCQHFACQLPVTDPTALEAQLWP